MMTVIPMTTDAKPLATTVLLDDDIPDAELEAIAAGMLKTVLMREEAAQAILESNLNLAIANAKAYFHPTSEQ